MLDKREFGSRLRKILGFKPGNLRLYEIAFIHRSASFTLPDGKRVNNERLEYLGDAILDAILSDFLFEKFPDASEGFMTKIRARIVNREVLNHLSVSMGINKIVVSNISSNHTTRNLFGDAFEALLGAVFLDKGFRKTKKLFIKKVLNKYLDLDEIVKTDTDYKSLVFEWVQKNKANLIFTYNEEYDFDLKKSVFSTTLFINREEFARGQGTSKKEAEQEASSLAWRRIKDISADF
ncbi:MAG: ribonuclease III [Bacteroidetes bacterium RBG_13_43_22]|nr:MAG: ribonuclease III [Bacteroidetes bacterium RBG_13_43_22]OFY84169.1 MAG: ribonuclease III [Bacteroidetes bacterium RBG_19FT_COMBO_42_7]